MVIVVVVVPLLVVVGVSELPESAESVLEASPESPVELLLELSVELSLELSPYVTELQPVTTVPIARPSVATSTLVASFTPHAGRLLAGGFGNRWDDQLLTDAQNGVFFTVFRHQISYADVKACSDL